MKRIAIVLDKNLDSGKAANTASVLLGQGSLLNPEIYSDDLLKGTDGVIHASIRYNVIILMGGPGQLLNLINDASKLLPDKSCVIFTKTGQGLNNSFEKYYEIITTTKASDNNPVGVLLVGDDPIIRLLTKKFSVYM